MAGDVEQQQARADADQWTNRNRLPQALADEGDREQLPGYGQGAQIDQSWLTG